MTMNPDLPDITRAGWQRPAPIPLFSADNAGHLGIDGTARAYCGSVAATLGRWSVNTTISDLNKMNDVCPACLAMATVEAEMIAQNTYRPVSLVAAMKDLERKDQKQKKVGK